MSPMMRQYVDTKEEYKDCILLYRLGDFYELFFDDAVTCSRVLSLTLTSKEAGSGQKAPMCGVPAKAIDTYVQKLIEEGYKVAICEQTDEMGTDKVLKRDITRIITPGTVVESTILDGGSNNYLASLYAEGNKVGVSYIDISTGEFYLSELEDDIYLKLNDLLSVIKPKEIIANTESQMYEESLPVVKSSIVPAFSYNVGVDYDLSKAKDILLKQLNASSLKQFNCSNKYLAITSAGALLQYVYHTQRRDLSHINSINIVDLSKYVQIDANSRRNLELTENSRDGGKKGSLCWVLDKTKTNMGKRTLKHFVENPLVSEADINYRLNGVEEFVKNIVAREQIKDLLNHIYDIERLTGKISYNNLTPKDCLALSKSLKNIPQICSVLSTFNSKIIKDLMLDLYDYSDIVDMIDRAIYEDCTNNVKEGGFIKRGFNAELDEIISLQQNSSQLLNELESAEKSISGIQKLKVGYNRVFGYYIEVPKSALDSVPFRYIRKQTLANCERFITEELKALEEKILSANDKKLILELELFTDIRNILLTKVKNLQSTSKAIGILDTLVSFATVSVERNYVKPILQKSNTKLEIIGGRHPVVEIALKNDFVPNDTIMNNEDSRTMLITGPNMAGKSTYMRQVALITIMAQIGCFVPAKSAKISIMDRIFTRIGASDNLMFGQSTFMVEMLEVSNILHNATNNSLILLDEIGRGTSTFDGLSIAWAIMEYIANNFYCKTLFSTHFHELTDLEGILDGVKNYKVQVKEYDNSIIFLRKIVRGSANQSFGIQVAALAELPEVVIEKANKILHSLEQHDLNKNLINDTLEVNSNDNVEMEHRRKMNEVCSILNDLDVNQLTPLSAFDILVQLKNTIKKD
ncbi:MAG: DNA mismatch repair protein MutS [Clostridiales bacterium]|nr:DNA mismatch repair protein MutS [Clostridiales bacterium]